VWVKRDGGSLGSGRSGSLEGRIISGSSFSVETP